MTWWMIVLAIVALGIGVWIGLGAPGWPHKPQLGPRRRLEKRSINPVQWGRRESERRSRSRRNRR